VDAGFAAFELALDLHLHSAGIAGELLYNTDLFDGERAIELAADYEGLLRQALAAPESRILGLRLPSDREPAPATRDTPIRRLRGAVAAEAPPEGLRERASESGGKRLSS